MGQDTPIVGFEERRTVLVVVDLAGFTGVVAQTSTPVLLDLLDEFFALVGDSVLEHGGRVLKYLGDGGLAVFDEDRAAAAVDCVTQIAAQVAELATRFGVTLEIGANVHLSTVHHGDIGSPADRHRDVLGVGVMHAFRMGAGAGIRISEPVYRSLASDQRGPWKKHRPPATYHHDP